MSVTVPPTVLDVARAVVRLDEHADVPAKGCVHFDGMAWTRDDLRRRVAKQISYHLTRHYGGFIPSRRKVTTRDVSAAMAVSGASPFTVDQHARAIAAMVRADFNA